jgi:hypothetical protein
LLPSGVVKLERDLKAGCSVGDRVDLSGFGKVGLKEQKTSKDTEEEFVRGKKKLKGEKKNSEGTELRREHTKLCPTAPVSRPGICHFPLNKIEKSQPTKQLQVAMPTIINQSSIKH